MNHFLLFFVIALLSLSTFASGGSIDNSLKGILLEKFTTSKGSKVLGCQKVTLESFLERERKKEMKKFKSMYFCYIGTC